MTDRALMHLCLRVPRCLTGWARRQYLRLISPAHPTWDDGDSYDVYFQ